MNFREKLGLTLMLTVVTILILMNTDISAFSYTFIHIIWTLAVALFLLGKGVK